MTKAANQATWRCWAIFAVAFLCLACADAGMASATRFTHPVVAALAGHQNVDNPAVKEALRLVRDHSRHATKASWQDSNGGFWAAMLPVLFVGLIAPLVPLSSHSVLCLGRPPAAPILPSLFQRPPPSQLL